MAEYAEHDGVSDGGSGGGGGGGKAARYKGDVEQKERVRERRRERKREIKAFPTDNVGSPDKARRRGWSLTSGPRRVAHLGVPRRPIPK